MPATSLIDPATERVGALVRDAFTEVLGERLDALLVHGSAVTGGYLPGFSDFDFLVYMHGQLSTDDSSAIQSRLGPADHAPFAYLQASHIIDLDNPASVDQRFPLIDGAYATLVGDYPVGWPFHDANTLRDHGNDFLGDLPSLIARCRRAWSVATGERRRREVRYQLTDVKPALRALLVRLGAPALKVWTAPYPELARRWTTHDPVNGPRFARLLESLPPSEATEASTGTEMLALLDAIAEQSQ